MGKTGVVRTRAHRPGLRFVDECKVQAVMPGRVGVLTLDVGLEAERGVEFRRVVEVEREHGSGLGRCTLGRWHEQQVHAGRERQGGREQR